MLGLACPGAKTQGHLALLGLASLDLALLGLGLPNLTKQTKNTMWQAERAVDWQAVFLS